MRGPAGSSSLVASPPRRTALPDKLRSPQRPKTLPSLADSNEKPASRAEIAALEAELQTKLALTDGLTVASNAVPALSDGLREPLREGLLLQRSRLLRRLGVEESSLTDDSGLRLRVQAETTLDVCDDTAGRLSAMMSVASAELGVVMRRLRRAYSRGFEEMRLSWDAVRAAQQSQERELVQLRARLNGFESDLLEREAVVRRRMDLKLAEVQRQFQLEQDRDAQKLRDAEYQILQTSESLRALNGIFRTMQQDEGALKAADLQLRCNRLEGEVAVLSMQAAELDRVRESLERETARSRSLEMELRQKSADLSSIRGEMARRDAVIASLMEKEALINAELLSLRQITEKKSSERRVEEADLQTPTSVLCIKCKKGLDDVSNIRAVLLAARDDAGQRLECETFRVLLPNLRGRRPDRSSSWLRGCMRGILLAKMREDVVLLGLRGEHDRFPHFVYGWFERENVSGGTGPSNLAVTPVADEDRWGLYYGVRALAKVSDSEGMLFWSLLDEAHKQDGQQFVLHCLSVALTMGGSRLWSQFEDSFRCGSVAGLSESVERTSLIWLHLRTAIDATRAILRKAPAPLIASTLETIDTMKERPVLDAEPEGGSLREDEPTHINLFMWLRIMLRQFQEDQNLRLAAVRLMFESASVGALTPQLHAPSSESQGRSVDYPQFQVREPSSLRYYANCPRQVICSALFPSISVVEIAALFSRCYEVGKKKVTASVFTAVADKSQWFAKALQLEALPLLTPADYLPPIGTGNLAYRESIAGDKSGSLTRGRGRSSLPSMVKPFEDYLATKLYALVHRKLTVLLPEFRLMISQVPEKWRQALKIAREKVQTALNESLSRIMRRQKVAVQEEIKGDDPEAYFVDGLQPFLEYKRLLSLILLIRSYTENPLLPDEIFANDSRKSGRPNLCRAESLLTHLENAIYVCGGESFQLQQSFERARLTIVVRRLQAAYKAHSKKRRHR